MAHGLCTITNQFTTGASATTTTSASTTIKVDAQEDRVATPTAKSHTGAGSRTKGTYKSTTCTNTTSSPSSNE